MIFPFYLAALGVSAGVVGAFGRRLVALGGYVTDFESGIAAAVMIASGYVVIQVAYVALVQLLKPFKSKGPHLTECLSLLSAVVLIPYLANVPIPWLHPKLAELEPAIYLAAFCGVHGFFKLATLFAATQAIPATQVRVLPYLAIAAVAIVGARQGFVRWHGSLNGDRTAVLAEAAPVRLGDTYVSARRMTEGLLYRMGALPAPGAHLTMRWANVAERDAPLEELHVTCNFYAGEDEVPVGGFTGTVALSENGWMEFRVRPDAIPQGAESYGVFWNLTEEPEWVRRTGLRPAHGSGREVLLSGPFVHYAPSALDRPSLVVILVEGLGADHMNLLGYERETTPQLTAFARRGVVWDQAYTACPNTFSTTMSLFTGLPPLMHGSTDTQAAPLPPGTDYLPELLADAGYATVAFSEGEGTDGEDLVPGTGIERGFQIFNPAFPQEALTRQGGGPAPLVPAGARVTLQAAAEWIREHREEERYLVFIRLRELRKPFDLPRYGKGYIKPWESVPQPLDVYDTALMDVDKQLGLFFDRLQEMGSLGDTCVVITSPYGLDFSEPERALWRRGGPGIPRLTEESLHVPLVLSLPEGIGRSRRGMVTLDALGATLADLAGVTLSTSMSRESLLDRTPAEAPVAIMGDPIAVSIRTDDWRYLWQSGLRAGSLERATPPAGLALYSIPEYREKKWSSDYRQKEPQLVRAFDTQLEALIAPYASAAGAAP